MAAGEIILFLSLYTLAFACWCAFAWWLKWAGDIQLKKLLPTFYMAAGVVAVLLAITPPLVSTDVYRYLWDGGLVVHGTNPYTITPKEAGPGAADPELYNKLDWKDQYTIYPPGAQALFTVAYSVYSVFGLPAAKLLLGSGAIVALWFLYRLVPPRIFVATLLNPLLLFETFNGAHIDIWVLAALLGAYYFFQKQQYTTSSVLLAGGIAVKLYPGLFVPLFVAELWRRAGPKKALQYGAICITAAAAIFAPLIPDMSFIIERSGNWFREMEFNASIYAITGSSFVSLFTLGAGILYLLRHKLSPGVLLSTSLLFLVSSSVVYPWYTLAVLPFALLYIGQKEYRYYLLYYLGLLQILFSFTYINVYLLYAVSDELRVSIMLWLSVVEYGALLAVILLATYKERRLKRCPY